MGEKASPLWWIELLKVLPGLIAVILVLCIIIAYRKKIRELIAHINITKFKWLGFEAEFSASTLEKAISAAEAQNKVSFNISEGEKQAVLKRLRHAGPFLRDRRLLWVDDYPANNRNERELLEGYGMRITTVTTSAAADKELDENNYMLVVTDFEREENKKEGLDFANRVAAKNTCRWVIAYVGTDQKGLPRPANLFGITNRPDELIKFVCDVAELERLRNT